MTHSAGTHPWMRRAFRIILGVVLLLPALQEVDFEAVVDELAAS